MDEVSQALSGLIEGGITAPDVLSAGALLDIRHILMEHPTLAPFEEMKATLTNNVPYDAQNPAAYAKLHAQDRCWPKEALRIRNHLDRFQLFFDKYRMASKATLNNLLYTNFSGAPGWLDLDFVKPSQDEFNIFKMNPVYCGTVTAKIVLQVEKAGKRECSLPNLCHILAKLSSPLGKRIN